MSTRIQVVLDEGEKELFRRHAEKAGLSLSAWLRRAARQSLELERRRRVRTVEDLRSFFGECDRREQGREPEWEEHLRVMAESRQAGT